VSDRPPTTTAWSPPPGIEGAELVAHGGFAAVYRGWQTDFNRDVAVKVLAADTRDPSVKARFDREVRAMGAVSDHPNVVPVYDAGVHDDRPYLVMPYLAGGSLADELRNGPLPPEDVVRVGRAVADALDAAHRAGLLHRDVKPANILRTSYGEPKLADFGVARFADHTATHGNVALTVAYSAPEVLRGEPASAASDVYSLGATLHALLRGGPPFEVPDGGAPLAMAMKIVSDEAPDLRAHGVPPTLAAVVERAMAKEPGDRFPSAAAFRDALDGVDLAAPVVDDATRTIVAAAGPPTAVAPAVPAPAPPPPPARRPPPPDRSSGAGWAAALVVLVVLGVIGAALYAANRDDGGGPAAATSTTAAPTSEPIAAPVEEATTTEAPPEQTTTVAEEEPAPTTDADPAAAAEDYFALLPDNTDEAWQRLTPRYQNESGGREAYEGWWSTIESVEVLSAEQTGDLEATVTLGYVRTDGTTAEETNAITFKEQGGQLLIDGSA
jgi:hypothetical protein